jgi:hypothetical protein
METKTCRKCGQKFPLSGFYCVQRKSKKKPDYSADCKDCTRKERAAWRRENPKKWKAIVRTANLKKNFGLTVAEYGQILVSQNGVCAACGQLETRTMRGKVTTLCVDHDHETGKIRGLLCFHCNTALGLVKENISRLLKLIAYLEAHKERK